MRLFDEVALSLVLSKGLPLVQRCFQRLVQPDRSVEEPLPDRLEVRDQFLHAIFLVEGVHAERVIAVAFTERDGLRHWLGIGSRGSRVLRLCEEAEIALPDPPPPPGDRAAQHPITTEGA